MTVAAQTGRPERYSATPWSKQRLYRPFIRAALLVALTLGFGTGVAVLAELLVGRTLVPLHRPVAVHATAQVYGWAGLFIMGVGSHIVPRFRGNARIAFPWPQRMALSLVLAGVVLSAAAATAALPGGEEAATVVVAGADAAVLGGVVVFAVTLGQVLCRGTSTGTPLERWLWCGLAYAVVSATLGATTPLLEGRVGDAGGLDQAATIAGLFGFVGSFVFGVSLRATSGFLRLRPCYRGLERAAFCMANAGIAFLVLAALAGWTRPVTAAGLLLYSLGIAAFAAAFRIFEPPAGSPADPRSARFLRAAYVWLAAAVVVMAWAAVGDLLGSPLALVALPSLHTFAMGFVTMTIFGFTARVLPLLEGRPLPFPRVMDAAFVLLNGSVALRLIGSTTASAAFSGVLALSGLLGMAALVCFTVVVWPLTTFRAPGPASRPGVARQSGRMPASRGG